MAPLLNGLRWRRSSSPVSRPALLRRLRTLSSFSSSQPDRLSSQAEILCLLPALTEPRSRARSAQRIFFRHSNTLLFDIEISTSNFLLPVFGERVHVGAGDPRPGLSIHGANWTLQWVHIPGSHVTQAEATKLRLLHHNGAFLTASVSSLTRASYTAQFTPRAASDFTELDVPANKLFPIVR